MQASLSKLVNNLSEIYSKECTERKVESVYDFSGLKNNKLYYKCNIFRKLWSTPLS